MKHFVRVLFLVVAALMLLRGGMPQRFDSEFPVKRFAQLPVLEGGRYKPIDTLARTSMLLLRGKQTAQTPEGKKVPASEWFMRFVLNPDSVDDWPVFLVDHDAVRDLLGEKEHKTKYFSYVQIAKQFRIIQEQLQHVPREPAHQNLAQKELVTLSNKLVIYQRLMFAFRPPVLKASVEDEYAGLIEVFHKASIKVHGVSEVNTEDPDVVKLASYLRTFGSLSDHQSVKFVPTHTSQGSWLNLSESLMEVMTQRDLSPVAMAYARLADAYVEGQVEFFQKELAFLETQYSQPTASGDYSKSKVKWEYIVNSLQPFSTAMALYVWVLLGVFLAWLIYDQQLVRWVFWVLLIAFLIHSFGLVSRMLIQGRPPVTNLYSSAIFVGWGAAGLGILLEWFSRRGLGSAVASIIGFLTLIIANHLMLSGDTMEMMRAVLDSNFWLTTHVITVSFGYSSTYLAGFLGVLYFGLGIFTKLMDTQTKQSLERMVYGIVCFSLLFSFVGTVLGGIWGDQSWGRFWGWDPKENGALMVVLWNALILHAKRCGLVRTTGFMNLAIFGNVITSWSWFGTNMLGVGLHSYGFMSAAFVWLLAFCFANGVVMIVGGWLPKSMWRSKV